MALLGRGNEYFTTSLLTFDKCPVRSQCGHPSSHHCWLELHRSCSSSFPHPQPAAFAEENDDYPQITSTVQTKPIPILYSCVLSSPINRSVTCLIYSRQLSLSLFSFLFAFILFYFYYPFFWSRVQTFRGQQSTSRDFIRNTPKRQQVHFSASKALKTQTIDVRETEK